MNFQKNSYNYRKRKNQKIIKKMNKGHKIVFKI